jgi:hypothetical protein
VVFLLDSAFAKKCTSTKDRGNCFFRWRKFLIA